MPNFYEMFETPKIHWPITFVVDTSGSMAGQRLVQLNSALHELSNILESLALKVYVCKVVFISLCPKRSMTVLGFTPFSASIVPCVCRRQWE